MNIRHNISLERVEDIGYNKVSDFVFLSDKSFCEKPQNIKYRKDFYMNTLVNLFYQYGNMSIIAVAIINGIIFVCTWRSEKSIEKLFNPTGNSVRKVNPDIGWDNKKILKLQKNIKQ